MKFFDPRRNPWQFRLVSLIVSVGLAVCLLYVWAAGVKFMRLLAKVQGEIAASAAPQPQARAGIAPSKTQQQGVVSVDLMPLKQPAP